MCYLSIDQKRYYDLHFTKLEQDIQKVAVSDPYHASESKHSTQAQLPAEHPARKQPANHIISGIASECHLPGNNLLTGSLGVNGAHVNASIHQSQCNMQGKWQSFIVTGL